MKGEIKTMSINKSTFDASRLDDKELNELIEILHEESEKRKTEMRNQAIEIFHNAFFQLQQIGVKIEVCTDEGYSYIEGWSDFSFKF